jgi:hypothetical protein
VLILPDEIDVDAETEGKLKAFVAGGGKVIASWHSAQRSDGAFALDFGIRRSGGPVTFNPSYVRASKELDAAMPATAFVMYETAETIAATGATVLADVYPSYFNRTYAHFSSHQQTPDDPAAKPLGAAVTEHNGLSYVAYPIFRLYRAMGQPLYKYMVRGLLARLLPDAALSTDLPSAGRASLTHQEAQNRHILHLLCGIPQVRGKEVKLDDGTTRVMEMIEDVPAIGPVTSRVRLPKTPRRVYDALSGVDVAWTTTPAGEIEVRIPGLRIHTALVFEA